MAIKNIHPQYTQMRPRWVMARDCYGGEYDIKKAGFTYLPPTSGQVVDGALQSQNSTGAGEYSAYKTRAIFPDAYLDAVEAAIGIMHREPPVISLPTVLEPMRTNSTLLGESLESLLRQINAAQLITGRLGLLGDLVTQDGKVTPKILVYNELSIINWNDTITDGESTQLKLVVIDESGYEMGDDLSWEFVDRYRILGLLDQEGELSPAGIYASAVVLDGDSLPTAAMYEIPSIQGRQLDIVPFVFINSKDTSPTPDRPPLDGLARISLAIYRGEADYRQSLFKQGQDTLVRIGAMADEDETVRTGAGARIDVPQGGDAKYIGVDSQGLPEQRLALENDYARAARKSAQIMDSGKAKESGDALRIRMAAQAATLPQIAKAGASGLELVLKALARWYGANEEEVVVTPNLNFSEAESDGQTLLQLTQSQTLGAPISKESIHEWMAGQGFTDLTYEEELERIQNEIDNQPPGMSFRSPAE